MAYIGIDVGDLSERHMTLVHIEKMDGEIAERVQNVLFELQAKVKRPPTGTFGNFTMMGPRKDKKAILIESQYVRHLRLGLANDLSKAGVRFSENFEFTPHVTDPLRVWRPGMMVPFLPWLTFTWKNNFKLDYELGVNTDGNWSAGA